MTLSDSSPDTDTFKSKLVIQHTVPLLLCPLSCLTHEQQSVQKECALGMDLVTWNAASNRHAETRHRWLYAAYRIFGKKGAQLYQKWKSGRRP